MQCTLRLLVIDDRPEDRARLARNLHREFKGLQVTEITGAAAFNQALDQGDFDLAITEFKLDWSDGLEVLRSLKSRWPQRPVIMRTGAGSVEIAVAAMKAGLDDYLSKSPPQLARLPAAVRSLLERVQERRARQQAEAGYARLFDRVPVGLYRVTPEGKIMDVNPALVELLGYPDRESLLAVDSVGSYADPEDRLRWQKLMDRDGVVRDFEVQLRCRDGSLIWVRDQAQVIRDERGQIVWYEGSLEDITGRKEAEKALKNSEARYRLLFESNPQPMWVYDLETLGFLKINQAAVEHYGYTREEFLAMTVKEIRPPEDVSRLMARVSQLQFSSGLEHSGEWRHRQKSGEMMDVEVISHEIAFNGRRARLVLARDITASKQALEAFKRLVYGAPIGIFIVQKGKFKLINPGFQKITGYTAEELIDQESLMLPTPAFKEEVRHNAIETLKGRLSTPYEYQIVTKDGETRWVMETVTPTLYRGERAALGYFMDIRERKKAEEALHQKEEQLRQAQKMEAVGRLAGGVAHDFNNLLTAIIGFTELLQMRVRDGEDIHMVKQILKASEKAAVLVRQLLAFSRRQVLKPVPLDVNAVVADMEKLLQRVIGEDISLKINLEQELGAVRADRGQLEQVIMNLVVNARDAMPAGGHLFIETRKVTLDENYLQVIPGSRAGAFVVLEVTDTGVGIEKEIQERIFEPFYTTKGPAEGTGLGLSTVYGIVKQHEGWINVYSEPGTGTTFKIYLPVAVIKPGEKMMDLPTGPGLRGQGERILLVEDEAEVREIATLMLQENGYPVVVVAADAAEAMEVFDREQGNFHLLFSDVVLSDQSGLQLVEELLARKPDLRVLLTSGYAAQKAQWPTIREKQYHFLQKPYTLNDLLKTVAAALKSGEASGATPVGRP